MSDELDTMIHPNPPQPLRSFVRATAITFVSFTMLGAMAGLGVGVCILVARFVSGTNAF